MVDKLDNIIEGKKVPNIQDEIGATLKEQDLEKVEVHIMPKRFLLIKESGTKSAKSMGILIIAGGGIILLVSVGFLYWYITKPGAGPETDIINISEHQEKINKEKVESEEKIEEEKKIIKIEKIEEEEEVNEGNTNLNATSSIPVIITASSSKATSSKPTELSSSTPAVIKTAIDTDSDGLTDIEEALLDSNPRAFDSDSDGYTDISELKNLYNPAGGGSLAVNPNIDKYTNLKYNYVLYYPNTWIVQTGAGDESIVFKISGDEFVQVIVQPDVLAGSLDVWYQKQFEDIGVSDIFTFKKTGWSAIRHLDSKIIYLKKDGSTHIFTMTYNISPDGMVRYQEIFEMMVRSLELK